MAGFGLVGSSWVGVLTLGVAAPAMGQLCPQAELYGPDPDLIGEVRKHLAELPLTATSTAVRCVRVSVDVRPMGDRVHLTVRKGEDDVETRVVNSPQTAASLISAWTAEPLADLSWSDLASMEPPKSPPRPPQSGDPGTPADQPRTEPVASGPGAPPRPDDGVFGSPA